MEEQSPYRKLLLPALLVGAAIVVVIVLFLIIRGRSAGANLEIISAPPDATFTIDGQKYKAGRHTLQPGTYSIRGEKEGFAPLTQDISVGEGLEQVTFALTPESEEAKEWAADHPEVYDDVESIGGQLAQEQGRDFQKRYPLTAKLPYNSSIYSINYSKDVKNPDQIYIRIDSKNPLGRQAAIAQIREWGFNPTDYNIVFAGLYNPFDPNNEEVPGE